jgi:hypothetical protein
MIETDPAFSEEDRSGLLHELRARLGHSIEIALEPVRQIPRAASGKQRLVVSTVRSETEPRSDLSIPEEGR